MPSPKFNKFRAAMDVLQRGRDALMDELADTVLDQADDLLEGGFLFHEFLENQGTRLHFLCLLLSQLEQSADLLDESRSCEAGAETAPDALPGPTIDEFEAPEDESPRPARKRRSKPRSSSTSTSPRGRGGKKLPRQSSPEGTPDDA